MFEAHKILTICLKSIPIVLRIVGAFLNGYPRLTRGEGGKEEVRHYSCLLVLDVRFQTMPRKGWGKCRANKLISAVVVLSCVISQVKKASIPQYKRVRGLDSAQVSIREPGRPRMLDRG